MPNQSATTWVHVFEEDSAAGLVFRREDADIPLSRRPRERFELHPDGSAVISTGGPDDRPVSQPGRWTDEDGERIIRDASGAVCFRIIEQSTDRLVVRRPT